MPDTLSPEERSAIDAYDGPVTACPPRTFTKGAEWTVKDSINRMFARKKKPLRVSRRAECARLVAAGKNGPEIAEAMGVTISGAYQACLRYGLEWPGMGPDRPPRGKRRIDHDDEIREMVLAGRSNKEIAAAVGFSRGYISKIVKRLGLTWKCPRGGVA